MFVQLQMDDDFSRNGFVKDIASVKEIEMRALRIVKRREADKKITRYSKSNYIIVDGTLLCYCDTHPLMTFCCAVLFPPFVRPPTTATVKWGQKRKKKTTHRPKFV